MRSFYATLFKAHGLLPDEIARQSPVLLFKMLNCLDGETQEIPQELGFFYGM